ncbi:hypothetical protein [Corallibacter sp.]|uniref:hypothetical protein n=1 Tax=Corallibacter sp. TaxID=2038084 RepID=UPI003AB5DBD6
MVNGKDQNIIIQDEIEAILADIEILYSKSGKRVSGNFETQLQANYLDNKAIIEGVTYLAGRKAGKMPPVQSILEWVKKRGIQSIEAKMTTTSLAWAIAKKIAKKGTNKENHLKVYEQVITPERIQEIIDKVSQFNVNLFVEELETQLELLAKNV